MKRAALNRAVFLYLFFRRSCEIVDKLSDVLQLALIEFFQIVDQQWEVVYDVIDSYKSLLDIVTK